MRKALATQRAIFGRSAMARNKSCAASTSGLVSLGPRFAARSLTLRLLLVGVADDFQL